MKRVCASLVLASFCVFGAFSQSNDFVDGLIESDSVSVGQAAYLVLVASDNLGDDADAERAFEMLGNFGWAPEGASADTPIRLKDYSYLLMSAFGLRGGLMYAMLGRRRFRGAIELLFDHMYLLRKEITKTNKLYIIVLT